MAKQGGDSQPVEHAIGPDDAPVTVVEYADYQCSHCAAANEEVKRLFELLDGRLRYVFRNFPLPQIHGQALQAAEAAEAAGAQGRFWEMHDLLFAHQDALDLDALASYADGLGLDVARFTDDLRRRRFEARVRRDVEEGVARGVHATPTFFVNGELHRGPATAEGLLEAIQGEPTQYGF